MPRRARLVPPNVPLHLIQRGGTLWEGRYRSCPTEAERLAAYRELFRYELDPGLIDEIRDATNGNFALGGSRFADQIAAQPGARTQRGKGGRPKKIPAPDNLDLPGMD